VLLAVGTKRGLFVLTSKDRKTWKVEGPHLAGHRVFHAALDQRNGARLFATDNGDFFGTYVRYSDDFGRTWKEPTQGIAFPEGSGLSLKNIWVVEPGRSTEPGVVYAGVDPAALFVSRDGGQTWAMNEGLQGHPTRNRWQPGFGGLCLHSIVTDPGNPRRMWVGISAVGVMRTDDGGRTWLFCNKGTRADFLPDKYPEFGQCVHHLFAHPTNPDVLYQQNHCGVYMSANAGNSWTEIRGNLPSDFGFPMAMDVHNPETLFTIVESDARANFGDQFTVYRTKNGGKRWERLTKGLPKGPTVQLGVLRHGMAADTLNPCGVYVGTNTGQVFASRNRGDSWTLVADFLPQIYSVTAAVL
jgi:photosystem II stability/assembly factor-like uncharacterized protein